MLHPAVIMVPSIAEKLVKSQAEAAWTQHVAEAGAKMLRTQANSWFVGANIPGKAQFLLTSPDSASVMRAKRAEVAAQGYAGFVLQ
jgi:cyclohexanone monooxygenase